MNRLGTVELPKQKGFFPSLLLIAVASQCVYYLAVLDGTYERCMGLVLLSIAGLIVGYFFGMVLKPAKRVVLSRVGASPDAFNAKLLRRISLLFFFVGLAAHLYYYSMNPVTSYGESYGAGRGSGFITVFFNFLPVSFIINEYLISRGKASRGYIIFNRVAMLLFCAAYLFYFMKRRQILFLLLAVIAIWGPKLKTKTKVIAYIAGILLILSFTIFGKTRGFFDVNGLVPTIDYIASHFTLEWISLSELEGKYISRTLDDVYGYVQTRGLDPSILIGVLFCMVPRALLGGSKPLAFPEWYTYHFYPADYVRGTGYAGSMVAEIYLIGGVVLVFLAYLVIGLVSARMHKRGRLRDDVVGNLVYAIYVYTLLLLPRYDLASLLIDVVFVYAPMIGAVHFCKAKHSGVSPQSVNIRPIASTRAES